MPVWNISQPEAGLSEADRKSKHFIIDRIKQDEVVPIVSNDISHQLLFDHHTAPVNRYAEYIRYPFTDQLVLSQMTQFRIVMQEDEIKDSLARERRYKALRSEYIDFIKNILYANMARHVKSNKQGAVSIEDVLDDLAQEFDDINFSEFAKRLGYPRPGLERQNPLEILASFPLSIYITTSYHNFLEVALAQAGKKPRSEVCRWRKGLEEIPAAFGSGERPSKDAPLVYHLYGFDAYPESMVLTEDDYLDFLVAISRDDGRGGIDTIPPRIRRAVSDSSLMLLGYGLGSWEFRVLFRGLLKSSTLKQQGISIQLDIDEVEREYLEKHLQYEADFEVHWKVHWTDIHTFLEELRQGLDP